MIRREFVTIEKYVRDSETAREAILWLLGIEPLQPMTLKCKILDEFSPAFTLLEFHANLNELIEEGEVLFGYDRFFRLKD